MGAGSLIGSDEGTVPFEANELVQPDRFFLNRFGFNERAFERTLGIALERKADYADLYFEFRSAWFEALIRDDSSGFRRQTHPVHGHLVGIGVTGAILRADSHANTLGTPLGGPVDDLFLKDKRLDAVQVGTRTAGHDLYAIQISLTQIPIREKVRLLEHIDNAARAVDPCIKIVVASFAAEDKVVMVVNSEGRIAADDQPFCRINVTVIAEDKGNRQTGHLRWRRAGRMGLFSRRRAMAPVRPRSGAPGIGQLGGGGRPRRRNGRGAGPRMAWGPGA
jgi:TldD protein